MLSKSSLAVLVTAFAAVASAHTSFTTLFVNGVNQGDGTCVRQPTDPQTSTNPVLDLTSSDMVCGRNGLAPVAFTCPVASGSTLTFEFRENPDGSKPGVIDRSHKGPCAVYMKQVSNMAANTAPEAGGWFKIYDDGYDSRTSQWCTEKLIAANGLLSVALPPGLPAGAYLVRPELLALHEAQAGNPQFYVGCAQIYVVSPSSSSESAAASPAQLAIPNGYEATIPGYVHKGDPSVTFNIYQPRFPYPIPGPPVFFPQLPSAFDNGGAGSSGSKNSNGLLGNHELSAAAQKAAGVAFVPSTCLIKNANWCGVELPRYRTEAGCWDASEDCYRQEAACYKAAPPSGDANCDAWDKQKCAVVQAACSAGQFRGPPNAGQPLQQVEAAVPGAIPSAWN